MVRDKVVYAFLREDDTPFYIGMGSVDRARNHKKGSRNYRWWEEMKSNPNYKFIIVDRSLSKQEAWDIEIDLIKKFGRLNIDHGGVLANIHKGGAWAKTKKVVRFDINGNRKRTYNSFQSVAEILQKIYPLNWISTHRGNISNCCKGNSKSYRNYMFLYESEVGDIDYIGPVKRKQESGGINSTPQVWIHEESGESFKSSNEAWRHFSGGKNNWPSGKRGDALVKVGYYLQKLKQL